MPFCSSSLYSVVVVAVERGVGGRCAGTSSDDMILRVDAKLSTCSPSGISVGCLLLRLLTASMFELAGSAVPPRGTKESGFTKECFHHPQPMSTSIFA